MRTNTQKTNQRNLDDQTIYNRPLQITSNVQTEAKNDNTELRSDQDDKNKSRDADLKRHAQSAVEIGVGIVPLFFATNPFTLGLAATFAIIMALYAVVGEAFHYVHNHRLKKDTSEETSIDTIEHKQSIEKQRSSKSINEIQTTEEEYNPIVENTQKLWADVVTEGKATVNAVSK